MDILRKSTTKPCVRVSMMCRNNCRTQRQEPPLPPQPPIINSTDSISLHRATAPKGRATPLRWTGAGGDGRPLVVEDVALTPLAF